MYLGATILPLRGGGGGGRGVGDFEKKKYPSHIFCIRKIFLHTTTGKKINHALSVS